MWAGDELPDGVERLTFIDGITDFAVDGCDGSRCWGVDGCVHLHGFQSDDEIAFIDSVSDREFNGLNDAGEWAGNITGSG